MSQPAHPEAESANTCKYPFALEAVHAVDEEEAAFLYDEIVVRRVYCQHGLSVPPGGTIVDVGANIGLFSVLAAADGARAVFAFEPIPPLVASLARNADALATPGVIRVIPCGLGSADSPAEAFHYFPHSPGESTRHCDQRERNSAVLAAESKLCGFTPPHQTEASPSVYSCPVMTLSTALDAFAIERVDLLKIDVEGDELAVLRGIEARHWPTIAQLVIEVQDVSGRLGTIVRLLQHRGFPIVNVDRQSSVVSSAGYASFIPLALSLYHVYAHRGSSPMKMPA